MNRVAQISLALLFVAPLAIARGHDRTARAQDGPGQAAASMFVGRVEGTDAFVGLATDGDRLVAYLCHYWCS